MRAHGLWLGTRGHARLHTMRRESWGTPGRPQWGASSHRALGSGLRPPARQTGFRPMWLPGHGRWLTVLECMASLGFPVRRELAAVYGLTGCFELPFEERNLVGNCMHMANVGVWQACAAAACSFV